MITIMTPVFNRRYIIGKLYESLKRQTCKEFEWLVVDDGSSDGLEECIHQWIDENPDFPIIYRYKDNGGKHTAINMAVTIAKGELVFIVDSDDYLADAAIECIQERAKVLNENRIYAGMSFPYYSYNGGKMMGKFPEDLECVESSLAQKSEVGVSGEYCMILRRDVLEKYPFQVYKNENFISEGSAWLLTGEDGYKFLFFKDQIYFAEYLKDGLTRNSFLKQINNPLGWAELIRTNKKCKQIVAERRQLRYIFMMHKKFGKQKICELLDISCDEYDRNLNQIVEFEEKLKKILEKYEVKKIALYGFGVNAYYFLECLKMLGRDIEYGIDCRAQYINYEHMYTLTDYLPEVDTIFITIDQLKEEEQRQIENCLKNKLPGVRVWRLQKIGSLFEWDI